MLAIVAFAIIVLFAVAAGNEDAAVTSRYLDGLTPDCRAKATAFLRACRNSGLEVALTSGLRTMAEQHALYLQIPKVTNADAGESAHNYGAAFDFAFVVNGSLSWDESLPWADAGAIGKNLGLVWGGDFHSFKDKPHFELENWRSLTPIA